MHNITGYWKWKLVHIPSIKLIRFDGFPPKRAWVLSLYYKFMAYFTWIFQHVHSDGILNKLSLRKHTHTFTCFKCFLFAFFFVHMCASENKLDVPSQMKLTPRISKKQMKNKEKFLWNVSKIPFNNNRCTFSRTFTNCTIGNYSKENNRHLKNVTLLLKLS